MNKFCMMCGKPLVPGTLYCGECGAKVTVPSPPAAPVSPVAPGLVVGDTAGSALSDNRKATRWLWVALWVFIIADFAFNHNASEALQRKLKADASWADVVKSLFTFG